MKHWKAILLSGVVALVTATLTSQAQVPGVNSTLQAVFNIVYDNSTSKQSYSATSTFVPPASADTVCTMQGSSTRTIRVRRLFISGQTGTGTLDPVAITRRASAITTSGTSVIVTSAKYDTTNANATGVVEFYTAVPTENAIVAEIIDVPVFFPALNPSVNYSPYIFEFGQRASALLIRGTSDLITVNLNHITLTSGGGTNTASLTCVWEWTEDSDF